MPIRDLRPVFYSVENQARVLSGWINPVTRDVFTTKADDANAIEVVPRACPAFHTGERVEFTSRVELYPAADILPHERGSVAGWDLETGVVSIFLEDYHEGLEDNSLVLAPFHDDWILEGLRRFRTPTLARPPRKGRFAIAALVVVAFVAGWAVDPPLGAVAAEGLVHLFGPY